MIGGEGIREDSGLTVFVICRDGLERGGLKRIIAMIERAGFEVVQTKSLGREESSLTAVRIREGHWGHGSCKRGGGQPKVVLVGYDVDPIPPSEQQRQRFPYVSNARVLMGPIRVASNGNVLERQLCDMFCYTGNSREAVDFIDSFIPEAAHALESRIRELRDAYSTREPVLRRLTGEGRRAKIEVIEFDGRLAVKKTFRPHQKRYHEREVFAMRELSRTISEIPPLLAADAYSVICPCYEDILGYEPLSGRLLPLRYAKQAIEALRKVYDAGFALIDARPINIIVDREAGLRLVDFEFLHRYDRKPPSFERCYDIIGRPLDFPGDKPEGQISSYESRWRRCVGLDLNCLLHGPTWLQHLRRIVFRLKQRWRQHKFQSRRLGTQAALISRVSR